MRGRCCRHRGRCSRRRAVLRASSPRDGRRHVVQSRRRNGWSRWEARFSVAKRNSMPSSGSRMRRRSLTSPTSRLFSRDIPASASRRSGERRSHGRTGAASASLEPTCRGGSEALLFGARRSRQPRVRRSARRSPSTSAAGSRCSAPAHARTATNGPTNYRHRLGQLAARTRNEQPSDPGDRRHAMARPRFATRTRVRRPPTATTGRHARDAACRFRQRSASRSCRRAAGRVTRADTARAAVDRRVAPHDSKSTRRSAVPPDTCSDRLGFGRQPLLCARDRSHAPKRRTGLPGGAPLPIPDRLHELVEVRVAALSDSTREVMLAFSMLSRLEPIGARCSVRLAAGRERSTRRGQRRRRRGR